MAIDASRTENWPALNYFTVDDWENVETYRLCDIPDEHTYEAFWECGSHPEVVERVWLTLGENLNEDCQLLVNGVNCLVHDVSGVLLALCMGTEYVIRVCDSDFECALEAGLTRTVDWIDRTTDLEEEFGSDWLFGCWKDAESAWIRNSYSKWNAR